MISNQQYTTKTDIIRYYLSPNFKALELSEWKYKYEAIKRLVSLINLENISNMILFFVA